MKLHLNQYNCSDWEDICLPTHRSMRSSVNRHIMDSGGYINKTLAIKLRFELASKGIKPDDYISPVYKCDSYTCERGSKECYRYFAEQAKET